MQAIVEDVLANELLTLPGNVWTKIPRCMAFSEALILRASSSESNHVVMRSGLDLKWGCRINGYLGTQITGQCLRFLRAAFPNLHLLHIAIGLPVMKLPHDAMLTYFKQLPMDKQLEFERDYHLFSAVSDGFRPAGGQEAIKAVMDRLAHFWATIDCATGVAQKLVNGPMTLCGLQSHESLNGKTGQIVGYDYGKERYQVKLGANRPAILVKAENINVGDPIEIIREVTALQHMQVLNFSSHVVLEPPQTFGLLGNMSSLRELFFFSSEKMNDEALQDITSGCIQLRKLTLHVLAGFGDDGLRSISNCRLLEDMELQGCGNTDEALAVVTHECLFLHRMVLTGMAVGVGAFNGVAKNSAMQEMSLKRCGDGRWAMNLANVVGSCKLLRKLLFSGGAVHIDFSDMPPSESMRELHLDDQLFKPETLRALQRWTNLSNLSFSGYGADMVQSLLSGFVDVAPHLRHMSQVRFYDLQALPTRTDHFIAALQEIWKPAKIERRANGVILHLHGSGAADSHESLTQAISGMSAPQELPAEDVIVHRDRAVMVDQEAARTQAEHQWADMVAHLIQLDKDRGSLGHKQETEGAVQENTEEEEKDQVHVLRFGGGGRGATEIFREKLLHGPELQKCRDALASAGYSCELPSGALIFVMPCDFEFVSREVRFKKLHPFHVVIAARFERELDHILTSIAYKKRPREKVSDRQEITLPARGLSEPGTASIDLDSDTDDELVSDLEFCVDRTFLCEVRRLRSPDEVVQSTTEAVTESASSCAHYGHARGANPRRYI